MVTEYKDALQGPYTPWLQCLGFLIKQRCCWMNDSFLRIIENFLCLQEKVFFIFELRHIIKIPKRNKRSHDNLELLQGRTLDTSLNLPKLVHYRCHHFFEDDGAVVVSEVKLTACYYYRNFYLFKKKRSQANLNKVTANLLHISPQQQRYDLLQKRGKSNL